MIFTLMGILVLLAKLYFFAPVFESNDTNYAIIFDGGSSGTRMYVYKYELDNYSSLNIPSNIVQLHYGKLGDDGIDKLKTETDVVNLFQDPILLAESLIPPEYHSKTYLSLAATGGMRLLSANNPIEAERIFNMIRAYFKSTKFPLNSPTQVTTITGMEEGIGEWLTVNYVLGNFQNSQLSETSGLLRLGGSSTQIAFVPNIKPNETVAQYFDTVKVRGNNFRVYSHSYLCLGTNTAFNLYHAYSVKKNNFGASSKLACYPKGYTVSFQGSELSTSCANGFVFNNNYEFTTLQSQWQNSATYTLNGNSKADACRIDVATIIPKANCKHQSNECGLDGAYQPFASNLKFAGSGDYFDAIDYTENLLLEKVGNSIEKFENLTTFICSRTYDELIAINKQNGAGLKKTVHTICFQNVYLLAMFKSHGVTSFENVQFVNRVNDYKIGWAMGYLINQIAKHKAS